MATTYTHRWKYDVFVSFRGEDIRKSFMDHLFKDFKQKGIHAFRDDDELPRGEEISPQLYKAIEESRFLIVIFSQRYASSSWCLRELVKILECKQMGMPKHEVQIIFYDVKPDVVRKQTEGYAKAFAKHNVLHTTEVAQWKKALSMAANLSGWDLQDMTNGYESKFIDSISKEIFKTLCDGPLHVGENIVGLYTDVSKMNLLRVVGSDKVHMIGICGISGIGKTTLAKAIYNTMYTYYKGSCFCEDVQGVAKRKGLTQVQMQVMDDILKTSSVKISNVSQGIMVIKQRMATKPILLVLDDVDHREQIEALAGSPNWFYPGSFIIFTAKDKQLLRSFKIDEIHDMEFLDDHKSLELFSLYAFRQKHPTKDFEELSEQVVKYVQGHPLALKVLACFLCGKTVREWESEMDMLRLYPNEEIQRVLRLSYDGLNLYQQKILLDISCSFIGVDKDFAASILDGCNFFADSNMRVLIDKSLINISGTKSLKMHELIQAMAREIVREESTVPGKRSRLWFPSEVYDVLSENKATEAIEVLHPLQEEFGQKFNINGNAFAHMKNLRILKLPMDSNVNFSGRLDFLSNELRLLDWHGCPFKFLPSNFYPESIVAIDLSYSKIKYIWTTPKSLKRLKVMKLRYCPNLTSTPDFTDITNLEELYLDGCVKLVKVHPSIGMLKRLVILSMRDCTQARSFPCKVEMDSLQVLILSGCLNLPILPIGRYQSTHWWWTSIFQIQPQILLLPSLASFSLLRKLDVSNCNISEVIPDTGALSCLIDINLRGNKFTSLPGSLSQLPTLQWLRLDGCKDLEVLPELPPSLIYLTASNCISLRELPQQLNLDRSFLHCILDGCPNLFKTLTIESQASMSQTQLLDSSITPRGSTHQLSSLLQYITIRSIIGRLNIIFHGNRIPQWFTNQSMGGIVNIKLPSNWSYDKFRGYGVCAVFKAKTSYGNIRHYNTPDCFVTNFDGASLIGSHPVRSCHSKEESLVIHESVMIWLHYTTYRDGWKEARDFVRFSFRDNENVEVMECGVRLVFDEDIHQETILSMIQDLPTPTQDGGIFEFYGRNSIILTWYSN